MYPIALGSYMVQQVISGSAVFDGTDFGRAKCQIPSSIIDPNAVIYVASKVYGAMANSITLSLIDHGAGITIPATTVTQSGNVILVNLQRDSILGLQARAVDVVNAINAYPGFAFPVRARYGGTGLGVMAATGSPVTLGAVTPGADPVLGPAFSGKPSNVIKWTRAANLSGGFFYFENETELILRQLECKFVVSSNLTLTVSRVNLDAGLEPILAEKIPFFESDITPALPDIAVSDVRVLINPFQAVFVECPAPGMARIDVARAGAYFLP